MTQTNVNTGGPGGTYTTDRSGTGFGMGMIMSLLIGVLLLALVAWWTFTQSGWFGPTPAPITNVNITTNTPGGSTGSTGGTGSTGSTGSTTGGSTTGSTVGR